MRPEDLSTRTTAQRRGFKLPPGPIRGMTYQRTYFDAPAKPYYRQVVYETIDHDGQISHRIATQVFNMHTSQWVDCHD